MRIMQTVSLLGGLGADSGFIKPLLPTTSSTLPILVQALPTQPTQAPVKGTCSADGQYIFDVTATGAGYWRRKGASEQCVAQSNIGPDVRVHAPGEGGGVSVSPTKVMKVGPFTIPVVRSGAQYIWGLDDYSKLNAEQAAMIKTQLLKEIDYPGRSNWIDFSKKWAKWSATEPAPGSTSYNFNDEGQIIATSVWPPTMPWGTWLTMMGWLRKIGFTSTDPGYEDRYNGFDKGRYTPIATFDHPDTGKNYGVWMRIQPVGPAISATSTQWDPSYRADVSKPAGPDNMPGPLGTKSMQLQFMVAPMPDKGVLGGAWDWIMKYVKKVVVGFYDAVWDTAEAISDALCAMTATPGALTNAAAKGGPEAAAAAQAAELLLQGKCPVQNPTPDGTPGPPGDKKPIPWGPIIAGGVALLGVIAFVLASPKKRPAPRAA